MLEERYGIRRGDIAGLLAEIGRDCAGAVVVLPAGLEPPREPPEDASTLEPIDDTAVDVGPRGSRKYQGEAGPASVRRYIADAPSVVHVQQRGLRRRRQRSPKASAAITTSAPSCENTNVRVCEVTAAEIRRSNVADSRCSTASRR